MARKKKKRRAVYRSGRKKYIKAAAGAAVAGYALGYGLGALGHA